MQPHIWSGSFGSFIIDTKFNWYSSGEGNSQVRCNLPAHDEAVSVMNATCRNRGKRNRGRRQRNDMHEKPFQLIFICWLTQIKIGLGELRAVPADRQGLVHRRAFTEDPPDMFCWCGVIHSHQIKKTSAREKERKRRECEYYVGRRFFLNQNNWSEESESCRKVLQTPRTSFHAVEPLTVIIISRSPFLSWNVHPSIPTKRSRERTVTKRKRKNRKQRITALSLLNGKQYSWLDIRQIFLAGYRSKSGKWQREDYVLYLVFHGIGMQQLQYER